jgi:hypothetical protein
MESILPTNHEKSRLNFGVLIYNPTTYIFYSCMYYLFLDHVSILNMVTELNFVLGVLIRSYFLFIQKVNKIWNIILAHSFWNLEFSINIVHS